MSRPFRHGDHVCALYDGEEEQLAIAAPYVAEGLQKGERCLYAAGSRAALRRFEDALAGQRLDAGALVRQGALQLVTNAEVHLSGGVFSSERMLQLLNDAVERALDAGFQGLRTCGDMTWLLDEPEGHEQVVEYEALLNQLFRGLRITGMCLFDRGRLGLPLIDHALATHPSVWLDGRHRANPFYELPAQAARRAAQPDRVGWKIGQLRGRA